MNYPYFFVYKNGVVCKQGKFSSSCFVTSTGKFITSSEKGRNLIKGKKLIFIRGLEYIFFSILFFIKNFNNIEIKNKLEENEQNINKNNKKYNIYLKYLCIFLFSIIYYFIFGIFLPIKISEILKVFYLGEFFKRFVIGILRVIILCLTLFLLRYVESINQIFRLNAATNIVANNYITAKMEKKYYRATNFLTILSFSFIFSNFMLCLIGQTINSFISILVNIFLTLVSFSVIYEICYLLDSYENKFCTLMCKVISFLTVLQPDYSEIIVCQTALNEVIFLRENKSRQVQKDIGSNNLIGFAFAYSEVKEKLKSAGIYEISDVDWIFATVLNKSRSEIKLLYTIEREDYKKILSIANRRAKGEPLSNIFGYVDFYASRFKVNEDVLTPRPETEILCEEALKIMLNIKKPNVLDLCCGSGAIGITLALGSDSKVTLSDISNKALDVAKENAKNLNAKVTFIESDLFENIKGKYDMIVSNPPYIKSGDIKSLSVEVKKYDPIIALDGGSDGYDFYRRIIKDSPKYLIKNGYLVLEVGFSQANFVKKLLQNDFENIIIVKDYNKIARVVIAQKKG